jgi:hypothetical protein
LPATLFCLLIVERNICWIIDVEAKMKGINFLKHLWNHLLNNNLIWFFHSLLCVPQCVIGKPEGSWVAGITTTHHNLINFVLFCSWIIGGVVANLLCWQDFKQSTEMGQRSVSNYWWVL